MRLYSWNINGYRAITGKPDWAAWLAGAGADVIGLQEIKTQKEQVAEEHQEQEGYTSYWLPAERKGYSGVAVFARPRPLAVNYDLPDPAWRGEGRLIHLEFERFHYLNVYFPNGGNGEERLRYKLGYYDAFLDYAEDLRQSKPIVACGDFNTAHREIDLARPKDNEEVSGFLPVERAWLDKLVGAGYLDSFRLVNGDKPDEYSWWSYRMRARARNVGWRIDYFFVSAELKDLVKRAWIEQGVMGSDHCPVGLELDI